MSSSTRPGRRRAWARLALPVVLATVAAWLSPRWLAPNDPFLGTVQMLPLVVLLFAWADQLPGGARREPPGPSVALVLLVAGLPVRHRLDLLAVDEIWAAALALCLGWAVWVRLPGLRRALGRERAPNGKVPGTRDGEVPDEKVPGTRVPRIGWAFFLLPLAVYLAVQPWALDHRQPDGDEPYYLLLTHSLVHDGDVDLRNNYAEGHAARFMERSIERQPGDPRGADGQIYSRHTAVLPTLLAPAYRLAGRPGAAATMAVLAAALAWQTLAVALQIWPAAPGGALLAWALLAFSPPLLVYAHQAWIEVPAALATAFALGAMLRLRTPTSAGVRRRDLVLALFCLALLPALKLRLVLVAVPLLVLAVSTARLGRRQRWLLGLVPFVLLAGLLAYNAWRFGNPLKMYTVAELDLYLGMGGQKAGVAGSAGERGLPWVLASYARGALGMFYDSSFGLFAASPIWLLLLPAAAWLALRRDRFLALAAWVVVPYWIAVAPRIEWYGGWSPPFRYPLVFLPILALVLVPLLQRRPLGTHCLAALLLPMTLVLALVWVVVPGTTYNLADGGSHLLHLASQRFEADVVRLFPSMVRPRTATLVWVLLSLATVPLGWFGAGRGPGFGRRLAVRRPVDRHPGGRHPGVRSRAFRRGASALAVVGLGLAVAAVPLLARGLPTRFVEAEDVWVEKTGGRISPARWTPQRPAYRGAWLLASRTELRAPVVAGGAAVEIAILARRRGKGPSRVEVAAGDLRLGEIEVEAGGQWQRYSLGPVAWPEGATLVLRCPEIYRRPEVGVLVDQIELSWLPPTAP